MLFQIGHPVDEITQGAAQPVQPLDHKRIAFAQKLLDLFQTWPFGNSAADLINDDLFTLCFLQRVTLKIRILIQC